MLDGENRKGANKPQYQLLKRTTERQVKGESEREREQVRQ